MIPLLTQCNSCIIDLHNNLLLSIIEVQKWINKLSNCKCFGTIYFLFCRNMMDFMWNLLIFSFKDLFHKIGNLVVAM